MPLLTPPTQRLSPILPMPAGWPRPIGQPSPIHSGHRCRLCCRKAVLHETSGPDGQPVDPALCGSILLITILVAFLEAAALKLRPQPPALVMGFGGIQVALVEAEARG